MSGDKNELLFSQFQINYNDLPAVYRKGSVLYFENQQDLIAQLAAIEFSTENLGELDERTRKKKEKKILKKLESQHKKKLIISHEDIIGNDFWIRNPHILNNP